MPCLEKRGLVQAHFAKYTPLYAIRTYFSLFCYLDPKSEPKLFTNMFLSFKKTRRKNSWCSGLCQVLLLVRSVWYLLGAFSWLRRWLLIVWIVSWVLGHLLGYLDCINKQLTMEISREKILGAMVIGGSSTMRRSVKRDFFEWEKFWE